MNIIYIAYRYNISYKYLIIGLKNQCYISIPSLNLVEQY